MPKNRRQSINLVSITHQEIKKGKFALLLGLGKGSPGASEGTGKEGELGNSPTVPASRLPVPHSLPSQGPTGANDKKHTQKLYEASGRDCNTKK